MKNFLIVRPDKMGDAIITQVAIEALFKTVTCNIDVFASNYSYRYYDDNPYVRKVFNCNVEDKKEMYSLYKTVCANEKYDAVFVLQARRRLQKMALLGKSRERFGFNLAFDFRVDSRIFEWISAKLRKFNYVKYDLSKHELLNLKDLLESGLEKLKLPKLAPLSNRCTLYSKNIKPAAKIPKSIVINISGKPAEQKTILPSMLMSLLLSLIKDGNKVGIVALSNDIHIANDIVSKIVEDNVERPEIISDNDVFTVANKLNSYEYYIGADGGLLHIASCLNLKCIGLFNDDIKPRWYPWTPDSVAISAHSSYEISPVAVINALATLGYK